MWPLKLASFVVILTGAVGLAPKMEGLVQADKCVGIVYNDPIKVAQEMTDLLREKENCEVVIWDLPEPVAPAISKCGIFAISATVTFPPISFPTQNEMLDG